MFKFLSLELLGQNKIIQDVTFIFRKLRRAFLLIGYFLKFNRLLEELIKKIIDDENN